MFIGKKHPSMATFNSQLRWRTALGSRLSPSGGSFTGSAAGRKPRQRTSHKDEAWLLLSRPPVSLGGQSAGGSGFGDITVAIPGIHVAIPGIYMWNCGGFSCIFCILLYFVVLCCILLYFVVFSLVNQGRIIGNYSNKRQGLHVSREWMELKIWYAMKL